MVTKFRNSNCDKTQKLGEISEDQTLEEVKGLSDFFLKFGFLAEMREARVTDCEKISVGDFNISQDGNI